MSKKVNKESQSLVKELGKKAVDNRANQLNPNNQKTKSQKTK